jgi:crossover junction endodeoxyribonuclease RuvC
MSPFIGLDPSLVSPGFAKYDGQKCVASTIKPASTWASIDARLLDVVERIGAYVDVRNNADGLVAIEGLSYGSNDPSAQERAALHYMLRSWLIFNNYKFIVVPPSTLKKWTCDAGNAKKELMLLEVFRRFGVQCVDNNQADAAALAFFAAAHAGEWNQTAAQAAVMARYKSGSIAKPKKGASSKP